MVDKAVAVVAGLGPGLSTAVVRTLVAAGYGVAALARSTDHSTQLAGELGADALHCYSCDVTDEQAVEDAFGAIARDLGPPAALIYVAGAFLMRPFAETPAADFDRLWQVNCRGAFLCARAVVPGMLAAGRGAIIMTGASASVKPNARFAAFGSSKFALRGMALGMARELGPLGIHVAHVVIDGVIWTPRTQAMAGVSEAECLQPQAIAQTYLHLLLQDRSAWTLELDVRPDREPF